MGAGGVAGHRGRQGCTGMSACGGRGGGGERGMAEGGLGGGVTMDVIRDISVVGKATG